MAEDVKIVGNPEDSLEGLTKSIRELVKQKLEAGETPNKEQIEKMVQDALEKSQARAAMTRKGEFDVTDAKDKEFAVRDMKRLISTPTRDPQISEFQKLNDYLYIASTVLKKPAQSLSLWKDFSNQGSELSKALRSTVAAVGDEFVPTGFSAQLEDLVRLQLRVAALHKEINMPTNPFTLPVAGADATAYLIPEAWSDDVSATGNMIPAATRGTANVSLTAKKLGLRHIFSEEVNEDSIISMVDFVRDGIVQAVANALEDGVINGDTAQSHNDSDITSATDRRKAFLGYRAHCVDQSYWIAGGGAAATSAMVANARAGMGKYGVVPSQLALVCGIATYNDLIVDTNVQTMDKYGPGATILNGELARVYGIPIVVSEYVRENLASTGIYSGSTTVATLVHRPSFVWGVARGITIKSGELIQTDQTVLVITLRRAFNVLYPIASNKVVYGIRNLAN